MIINRGLALATLCTAIIGAGHSVEVWVRVRGHRPLAGRTHRFSGMARVITAGEPFDVGRLIFAVAHPVMLRRLWFAVWDAQPKAVAKAMVVGNYGYPPYTLNPADLPGEVTDLYVVPCLAELDRQWDDLPAALSWGRQMFSDLGLIQH